MISEVDVVLVKTMNYVGVVYYAVNLFLVLCLIYFGLLTFVKFHENSSLLAIFHSIATLHQSCKTLKIAALHARF